MELKFVASKPDESDCCTKTSQLYRAVLTVSPEGQTISLRNGHYSMHDWAKDSLEEIIEQCPRARDLEEGESITVFLWLKPWSYQGVSYYGDDYDAGWDVIKHRTVRYTKLRRRDRESTI